MFISALLRNYRIEEYIQFMHDVQQLCINNDPAALQLGTRLETFTKQFTLLEAAYAKPLRHELTEVIKDLDAQRDRLFSQINMYLSGNQLEANTEIATAAGAVLQKINDYGGVGQINKLNYQAQTAALRNLIDDVLAMPQLDTLATMVNYRSMFQTLQTINEEFRVKFLERTQNQGTLSNEEAFLALREPMNEAYYKLLFRIEAGAEFNEEQETPLPNFKQVSDGINDAIRRVNKLVEARKSSSDDSPTNEPTANDGV